MVQGNHFSKLSAFVAVAEHGAAPQKRCSIRPVAQPGPSSTPRGPGDDPYRLVAFRQGLNGPASA